MGTENPAEKNYEARSLAATKVMFMDAGSGIQNGTGTPLIMLSLQEMSGPKKDEISITQIAFEHNDAHALVTGTLQALSEQHCVWAMNLLNVIDQLEGRPPRFVENGEDDGNGTDIGTTEDSDEDEDADSASAG
jgi:hypothetical protein